jgi:hypothetical protein
MCISAEVSILTFLSSSVLCLYLFKRNNVNDRVLAVWIFLFALIQFLEYLMWTDYDNKKNINNIATKIGLLVLLLQPLVLSVGMFFYGNMYTNSYIKIFIKILIVILCVIFLLSAKYVFDTRHEDWSSKMGPNCHLIWYFTQNKNKLPSYTKSDLLFVGPFAFFLTLIKPFPSNLIYMLYGGSTLLYTHMYKGLERGTYWCWMANIIPILVILFNR